MIYPLTDATTGRKANAYEHSACQPSVSADGASGGGIVNLTTDRKADLMTTQTTDPLTLTQRPIDRTAFRLGTAIGLLEGWSKAMEMSEPMRGWMIDIMTRHTNEWIKEQSNEPDHG
jgi:hypothetical protein